MAEERDEPPADFVSYVERRLRPLEYAARQLTDDDAQSGALARELLSLVAMRWPRPRGGAGPDPARAGAAADRQLHRLFAREVADAAPYHRVRLDLDRMPPPVRRPGHAPTLSAAEEAAAEAPGLWARGRAVSRRRLLTAGAVGVVALTAAGIRAWTAAPVAAPPAADPLPGDAPVDLSGVDELPSAPEQARLTLARVTELPRELAPGDPRQVPALSARPLPYALALLAPADLGVVLGLGPDGSWRWIDAAPEGAGDRLGEGALSGNGTRAAFPLPDGVRVVDLATGKARSYGPVPRPETAVWLDPRHLLLGVDAMLELSTGRLLPVPVGSRDAAAPRREAPAVGTPNTVLELLSVGEPPASPARVIRWEFDARNHAEGTRTISGPRARFVGPFRGAGFTTAGRAGLAARLCAPARLPTRPGWAPDAAVVVLDPVTAQVRRMLVADERVTGEVRVLGWLDDRRVLVGCAGGAGAIRRLDQRVLAWDVHDGRLGLVATVALNGRLSLADLAGAV